MDREIEFVGGPLDGEVRNYLELPPFVPVRHKDPSRIHIYRPDRLWKREPFPYRWAGEQ